MCYGCTLGVYGDWNLLFSSFDGAVSLLGWCGMYCGKDAFAKCAEVKIGNVDVPVKLQDDYFHLVSRCGGG